MMTNQTTLQVGDNVRPKIRSNDWIAGTVAEIRDNNTILVEFETFINLRGNVVKRSQLSSFHVSQLELVEVAR